MVSKQREKMTTSPKLAEHTREVSEELQTLLPPMIQQPHGSHVGKYNAYYITFG